MLSWCVVVFSVCCGLALFPFLTVIMMHVFFYMFVIADVCCVHGVLLSCVVFSVVLRRSVAVLWRVYCLLCMVLFVVLLMCVVFVVWWRTIEDGICACAHGTRIRCCTTPVCALTCVVGIIINKHTCVYGTAHTCGDMPDEMHVCHVCVCHIMN